MTDGKLSAALDEVRERSERPLPINLPISNDGVRYLMESANDVPRLLAGLDAVLELAADWKQEAAVLDCKAELPGQAIAQSSLLLIRAQGCEDHSRALTQAISRALLPETENADG